MLHCHFPSIEQFRTIIKRVKDRAQHDNVPLPTLIFNGSTKLHGSNCSVVKDPQTSEIWCQSRSQIITTEADNAGFAQFISNLPGQGIHIYLNIAAGIYGMNHLKPGDLIAIYGEFCGQGIQKGVAIAQVPKRWVVFGIKIYTPGVDDDHSTSYWFSPDQLLRVHRQFILEAGEETMIFSIQKFQTWNLEIDFAHPEAVQKKLVELTNEVEKCCPVGMEFGITGVGEGIVWRCVSRCTFKTSDLIFKVKGEAHSVTKVKTLAAIDVEKFNSLTELMAKVMTENRMKQMYDSMLDQTGLDPTDVKNLGQFIKLCVGDAIKEERDTIEISGFTEKEFTKVAPGLVRQWFFSQLQ